MIRVLRSLTLVLAVLAFSFTLQPATAQTETPCQDEIDSLITFTDNTTFVGRNAAKDEAGLLIKLDEAKVKLGEGKYDDAIQKLTDFRDKVGVLATQGKIDSDDATALIAGADGAIDCIEAISSQP